MDGLTLLSITLSSCPWVDVLWLWEDGMLNLRGEGTWHKKSGLYLLLQSQGL